MRSPYIFCTKDEGYKAETFVDNIFSVALTRCNASSWNSVCSCVTFCTLMMPVEKAAILKGNIFQR